MLLSVSHIHSLLHTCNLLFHIPFSVTLAASATIPAAEELTHTFACRFSSSTEQSSASRLMRRHKRRRRKQKAPRIERVRRGWLSWGEKCRAKWAAYWISSLSSLGLIRDSAAFALGTTLSRLNASSEISYGAVNPSVEPV